MKILRSSGFTLIEVIVAIILSAIMMAAILPMLDRVFQLSHEPRTTLQQGISLQAAMDGLVVWDAVHSNNPALLQAYVAANNPYQGQTVVTNRFVAFTNGGYSTAPATNNLLHITLRNPLGETVTRLFTVPPL
ncbi:MAG TPA: hypothetical protein DCM68_00540 [Verrucomicrobia bacterium]|nr:hypothetical protein [Verrucomicrobiota bacterium]